MNHEFPLVTYNSYVVSFFTRLEHPFTRSEHPQSFTLRHVDDGPFYITTSETKEHISIVNGQLRADYGSPNTRLAITPATHDFFHIVLRYTDLVWTVGSPNSHVHLRQQMARRINYLALSVCLINKLIWGCILICDHETKLGFLLLKPGSEPFWKMYKSWR
jgi:hypothetical protein